MFAHAVVAPPQPPVSRPTRCHGRLVSSGTRDLVGRSRQALGKLSVSSSSPADRRWLVTGRVVPCVVRVLRVPVPSRAALGAHRGHMSWAGPAALGRDMPGHRGTVQPGLSSCWPGQQAGLTCVGWAIEATFGPWRRR
jgi:hypothetical protein